MNITYLLALALAPALLLLKYVWNKDKSKEPFKMLVILFLLGVVSCIPAALIEQLLNSVIDAVLTKGTYFYYFILTFFGVALVEEGLKFLFMYLYTHKHREFNGLFDGMVYAIFVSLGFAAFENVFYVMEGGAGVAITRAIMSVPGHMFFAVFMGYYYSMWHTYKLCHDTEQYFAGIGYIIPRPPQYTYKRYLVRN